MRRKDATNKTIVKPPIHISRKPDRRRIPGIGTATVLLISAIALSTAPVQADAIAPTPIRQSTAGDRVLLGEHMQVYVDREGKLSLHDLLLTTTTDARRPQNNWHDTRAAGPNFGFTRGAYWLRFSLINTEPTPLKFYIEAPYPALDDVRLYAPRVNATAANTTTAANKIQAEQYEERRSGDRLNFREREVDYHHIVFHVTQPPKSQRTYYLRVQSESSLNATFILWNAAAFARHSQRTVRTLSMLYAVLAVMLLFNFLLSVSLREKSYLYFSLYLLSISLFLFTIDGLAFQYLWPDWPDWANLSLPLFMNLAYISALIFARHYLRTSRRTPLLDRIMLCEVLLATLLAILVFILSYNYSIIAATALAALVSTTIVAATAVGVFQRHRPAYYFGAAWTLVLAGVIFYSLKTFAILPDNFWTTWSIHTGLVLQVVMLSLGLADRINVLRLDLRRRLTELRAAGTTIRSSEKKYKHLVESSGDIIFSLDAQGTFLTANRAIQTHLGLRPAELIGTSFLDLLYHSPELEEIMPRADFQRELIIRELGELIENGNPVVFKAEFTTRMGEPRQLEVRLERVQTAARKKSNATEETAGYVLLGKAATVLEDSISRFIEAERQIHVIGNFLNIADLITERIIKNTNKYADSAAVLGMHICVREMIINAIEHGNLAVSYAEKTRATDRETYIQLLLARQKDPRFRDRKVTVIYSLNNKRVLYRIRDEGAGFDHRRLMAADPNAPNAEGLAHGRGITMARNIFDVVRYNDAGNQVTLIKRFD